MTSFPMVLAAWFAEVSLGKPPIMAIALSWTAIVSNPATTPWEKVRRKPPMMATTLFLDGDHANPRDHPAIVWEKVQRNPPIMAILLSWTAIAPNPATNRDRWEKVRRKSPIMAFTLYFDRPRAKVGDNPQPAGKKSSGNRQSWRFPRNAAVGSVKPEEAPLVAVPSAIGHSSLTNPRWLSDAALSPILKPLAIERPTLSKNLGRLGKMAAPSCSLAFASPRFPSPRAGAPAMAVIPPRLRSRLVLGRGVCCRSRSSPLTPIFVLSLIFWGLPGSIAKSRADEPEAVLPPAATRSVSFDKDIRPILRDRCHQCHGSQARKGGLRLDDRAAMLTGGDSGPAIAIGASGESLIIEKTAGLDPAATMPPPGKGERLTAEQIGLLRAWIDQGAVWGDDAATAPKSPVSAHWAFQPIRRARPPAAQRNDWVRNPIDAFILRKLESESFAPSPEAERAVLIRRLSLDLLGLAPTLADVEAFVNDKSPDAYEKVVDRYLASPHYGERWGRHWLDLARYADSDGYEKDSPRPWAWRYRDWVINALNADMPFDQFTIEQIAGDLLPNAGTEQKLATGFHRNTLTNREGGVDQEEYRVAAVIDRVSATSTVWLGLTMACAQCHSHKYDPISQREYYRFFAFFNESDEWDIDAPLRGVAAPAESPAKEKGKEDAKAKKAKAEADAPKIMTMGKLKAPRQTHILLRGDFLQPGDAVQPGAPEILPVLKTADGQPPTRVDLAYWLVDPANPLTARITVNRIWAHLFGRGLAMPLNDLGTQGEPPTHPELLDWLASELIREGWSQKRLIRRIVTSATYRQSSRHLPALIDRDPKNLWLARQNRLRVTAETVRDLALDVSGLLSRKFGGPSVRPPLPPGMAELGYAGSVKWTESQGEDKHRRGVYTFFQRTVPYPMLMTFDAPDSNVTCARRERSNTPLQALTLLNDPVFVECARGLGLRALKDGPAADSQRLDWMFRLCLARTPSPRELERLSALLSESKRICAESPDDAQALLAGAAIPEAFGASPADAAAWIALARILLNLDEFTTRE